MSALQPAVTPFRFDPVGHVYTDLSGRQIPSVTQLLKKAGYVDSAWFTDAGRDRGTAVHDLTADYDMGVWRNVDELVSPYRGYVLAWVSAMKLLPHEWTVIEEGIAHPSLQFAGKPDRGGRIYQRPACNELKTGAREPWHGIQLSLQCLLLESRLDCPAEQIDRYATYLTAGGKFTIQQFKDRTDFAKARKIIQEFAA